MTSKSDFAVVTRRGRRARTGGLVVYLLNDRSSGSSAGLTVDRAPGATMQADAPSRFGLVVGQSVGGSVVRHRVSRRLRAQLAERVPRVPRGSRVVVRALPESADEPSASLGGDLDKAFARLLGSSS